MNCLMLQPNVLAFPGGLPHKRRYLECDVFRLISFNDLEYFSIYNNFRFGFG